jgi:hypothetical protein
LKQELETDDTKENLNQDKELYSRVQVMYYKIMEFKKVLETCKKQIHSNQNVINFLIVNLPRMKEFLRKNQGKICGLTLGFVLPKLSELGFYNSQTFNL